MKPTALLSLLLPALLLPALPAGAAEDVDRIVLRVNGEILTLVEYEKKRESFVTAVLQSQSLEPEQRQERLADAGREVVFDSFREMLLLSRAKQLAVRADEEQVDQAIREIRERQGITTDAEMEQALAASSMTMDGLRDKMRREILWSQVVGQEVTQTIEIPDEELRAHYRTRQDDFTIPEKRRLAEIIVLEERLPDPAERQAVAEDVRQRAVAAGGLEGIELPESATSPIELGWLTAGELDPALAGPAFAAGVGEITEPVEGRGGLHVLHVLEVEPGRVKPYSEVEGLILARERNLRFDRALREYLADLEANAWIVEDLPPDAVGYRELAGTLETARGALDVFRDPTATVPEKPPAARDQPPTTPTDAS